MDSKLRADIEKLKNMSSEEAASWLIESYPYDSSEYGHAIAMLSHRSWKKKDQIRLAKHYFKKIPFSSGKPYEAFSSFMSVDNLVRTIRENMPSDKSDIELLKYHVEPVLRKSAKTEANREIVDKFISELR